jgi:cell division protein ZapD
MNMVSIAWYIMDDMTIFEFPANDLVRVALRLEYLFLNALPCSKKKGVSQHRNCLILISQILCILEKPELRSKLYKELSKFNHIFIKLNETADVNKKTVCLYIDELSTILNYLNESSGNFAQALHMNHFLKVVKQSLQIPGGECCYNCPELYVWLQQSEDKRQFELTNWLNLFGSIRTVIRTYLKIIRLSGDFTSVTAKHGYYQCQLSAKQNLHMIRIQLLETTSTFPKVLTGQHGISLQLFEFIQTKSSMKYYNDCQIEMALCCL